MSSKVLIANRGEIALRVQRSCRELGLDTVAVHSSVDEESLHVKLADESVCIGPARPKDSYLNVHQILSAAEITHSDAVHPGYGFLSENEEFALNCKKMGLIFIGPNPEIIRAMGDKIESKKIAEKAGLPILKSLLVNNKTDEEIRSEVIKVGLPVLIKASAGGGGRGMKEIHSIDDLIPSISRLKTESKAAFGDDTLFIEKFIQSPRHIEVQILGDNHGNVIHLGERDCTIQRRYQKVIEEAPSPVLDKSKRAEILDAAVSLAKSINYNSAGTIEFLYDQDSEKFYFMEMNTRIQVEHPVTEQLTGVDLVTEQIKSAFGEKLKLKQSDIEFKGHVIEFRINAENFLTGAPSPGRIDHYHRPGGMGVRVDDFIYTGYEIQPFYDSMLAKIIVKNVDRDSCINRSKRVLDETVLTGIESNLEFHKKILESREFLGNNYSTNFLKTFLK